MKVREPKWRRFAQAALGDTAPVAVPQRGGRLRQQVSDVRRRLVTAQHGQLAHQVQPRPDIRLLPSVVAAWAMAATAIGWSVGTVQTVLVLLSGGVLGSVVGRLLWRTATRRKRARPVRWGTVRSHVQLNSTVVATPRWLAGAGSTVLLAGLCLLGVLLAVELRNVGAESSELERKVAEAHDEEWALTLEVASVPLRRQGGHGPPRVIFDAVIIRATAQGLTASGRVLVRVVAGEAWAGLEPGDQAWTAGTISPAGSRDRAAGFFRPSTAPMAVMSRGDGSHTGVISMRAAWRSSVDSVWAGRSPDTSGLLPGMVMGDRSGMGRELNDAMKTVGLTHLTAVSGANCTLVLASLMLILRSVRTPRLAAFLASGAGLLAFVVLVGPDPSVLRAAVMGGIGAMAMLGGRPKRTGALLSVSIIVLLVSDPWLAVDYAFILSVLATVGLHVVGRRCVGWLSALLPLWLAQAVAIPLAAQLFCAPVIVLLQARLTPYAIPANMAAAPVVALVTTVGTLGLVVATVLPPLAGLCAAVSGAGAWWVAAVATWMSALPAASLPWPGGGQGVILMTLLNTALLTGLFAIVERGRLAGVMATLVDYLPPWWRIRFGFSAIAVVAAVIAAWWTVAVTSL